MFWQCPSTHAHLPISRCVGWSMPILLHTTIGRGIDIDRCTQQSSAWHTVLDWPTVYRLVGLANIGICCQTSHKVADIDMNTCNQQPHASHLVTSQHRARIWVCATGICSSALVLHHETGPSHLVLIDTHTTPSVRARNARICSSE
jgi:hypothetical protein